MQVTLFCQKSFISVIYSYLTSIFKFLVAFVYYFFTLQYLMKVKVLLSRICNLETRYPLIKSTLFTCSLVRYQEQSWNWFCNQYFACTHCRLKIVDRHGDCLQSCRMREDSYLYVDSNHCQIKFEYLDFDQQAHSGFFHLL